MAMTTASNWRVNKGTTHSARIAHILESGLYSDVKLIVGPDKNEILAHKLPLKIASPYFEKMFELDADKIEFNVPDIDEPVFRQFMEFVYTGEWSKDPKSAVPLLNAANVFEVSDLAKACREILKANLTEENALTIFRQAAIYNENELRKLVKEVIYKYAYNIIESKDFLILREENVEELIKADEFAVKDEVQLFDALVRWAQAECVRQNHPITSKCCGSVLQKLIPLVRFPQMDKSEFASSVAFREILTPEQEQACMMYVLRLEARGPFNAAPRKYHLPKTRCIAYRLPYRCVAEGPKDVPSLFSVKDRTEIDGALPSRPETVAPLPSTKHWPEIGPFTPILPKFMSLPQAPALIGSVSEIIWHRISFMAEEKVWLNSVMLNPDMKATPITFQQTKPTYSVEVRLEDEALENIYAVKTQIVKASNTHFSIEFDKPVKIEKTVWYTVSLRVAGAYEGISYTGKEDFAICNGSDWKEVKIRFRNSTSPDKSDLTTVHTGQMAQLGFLLY